MRILAIASSLLLLALATAAEEEESPFLKCDPDVKDLCIELAPGTLAAPVNFTFSPESNTLSWAPPPSLVHTKFATQLVYGLYSSPVGPIDPNGKLNDWKTVINGTSAQLPDTLLVGHVYEFCLTALWHMNLESFTCGPTRISVTIQHGITTQWVNLFEIERENRVRVYFPERVGFETLISFHNTRTGEPAMIPQRFAPHQQINSFSIELPDPAESFDFTIQQRNGSGAHFEQITHVPAARNILPPVADLKFVYYSVTWSPAAEVANYTFVWCSTTQDSTLDFDDPKQYLYQKCNGRVFDYAATLDTSPEVRSINRPYLYDDHRYIKYGVVLNTQTGTSGIVWLKCAYTRHAKILQNFRGEPVDATTIQLLWDPTTEECSAYKPGNSFLKYCPAEHCEKMEELRFWKYDQFVTVTNLQPGTMYKFVLNDDQNEWYKTVFASTDKLRV